MNKSKKMRKLFDENEGISISEISDEMDVRYSFVYQVIRRHCDKNDLEFPTNNNKPNKSDKIRNLYDTGMTIGEISHELNTNYSYCWSVVDKYRKEKE